MTALPTGDTHVAATTPYPWPWNGDLAGCGSAAVVVVPRGGWPPIVADCAERIAAVAGAIAAAGGAVVAVSTAAPGRAPDPDPVEPVTALRDRLGLDPAGIDALIAADGIDGFSGSALEGLLRGRGIERLILVGAGLETCVHSTMRSANDRGFECLLVVDASAPYDPDLVPASVSMIEMSGGILGAVAVTDDVVRAFTTTGA